MAPEVGPRRPQGKLFFLASPWQRAPLFPGAVAEVGGARAEVQVGSSHLGRLQWPQTLGLGLYGLCGWSVPRRGEGGVCEGIKGLGLLCSFPFLIKQAAK